MEGKRWGWRGERAGLGGGWGHGDEDGRRCERLLGIVREMRLG